jgi:hypothetical protein
MKRILAVLVLVLPLSSAAWAGEIFGKLVVAGAPVEDGTSIAAKCGDKTFPPVKTGKGGSYHLAIDATGKCTLMVTYKNQSASLEVASYEEPVQVDIVLEMKDGKLAAHRK